ncbi:hypothetical protein [Flavobacterium faecale]|uniref:hypothetical protein n=1 Tax=Flavobacterium faecale TaxID=1355330 RepID=UPI003AAAB6F1
MKKKLNYRFFLYLIVIIFSGYSSLFATNFISNSYSFSIEKANEKGNVGNENVLITCLTSFHIEQPFTKNIDFKLRATDNEVEEDEQFSSKKELLSKSYFASFYQILRGINIPITVKKKASYKTIFNNLISYKRYVFFQVFRI